MKKLLLFLCFIAAVCSIDAYSQTLTPSPTTVENNGTVTLTGENETLYRNITGSISFNTLDFVTVPTGYWNFITITNMTWVQEYDNLFAKPTKFSFKIANSSQENITVTIPFKCVLQNSETSAIVNNNYIINITVTVKPTLTTPTVYYNDAKSQIFYKNNCGVGFESDPITYTVPKDKYSAPTKQEANAKAQAEINANGQNKANTEGVCKQVYYNVEMSQNFVKNNCGTGSTGSTELYVVAASKHKSLISQSDADLKATNDLTTNGQSFANSTGHCTEVRKRYNALKRTSACSSSGEVGLSIWIRIDKDLNDIYQNTPSQVFVYTTDDGNTKVPAGHYKVLYPIDGSQTGIHVFNVDSNGRIIGYTQCSN